MCVYWGFVWAAMATMGILGGLLYGLDGLVQLSWTVKGQGPKRKWTVKRPRSRNENGQNVGLGPFNRPEMIEKNINGPNC